MENLLLRFRDDNICFVRTSVCAVALLMAYQVTACRAQDGSALNTLVAMEQRLIESIEMSEKSVVAIARVRKGSIGDPTDPDFVPHQFGTGVVIDKRGLILTNYHLLGEVGRNDYYVWIQKRPYPVISVMKSEVVKAADPWTDLAVLEIEADDLQPIKFGDVSNLRKGQMVISLGNPYAIARDGQPSASWGIISNLSRKATPNPSALQKRNAASTLHEYGTLIQTDAKLNLGTSGGALLNLKGEMIGLTTSQAAMQQYETAAGFAIPTDEVFIRAVEALKNGDQPEFGFLGIAPANLSARARQNGTIGVEVERVIEGSPAAFANVIEGDRITHIDDQPIPDTSRLMRELSGRAVETKVSLSITRPGAGLLTVPVTLSKKRIESDVPAITTNPVRSWRGIQVDYPTAVKDFLDISHLVDRNGCVAITDVQLDSAAWKAGLRPRTFVSHVGTTRVKSPREFFSALEKAELVSGLHATIAVRLTNSGEGEERVKSVEAAGDANEARE